MKKLVVKVGTSNLFGNDGNLDQFIFNDLARQIVEIMKLGVKVIVVSSGAVKAGRESVARCGLGEHTCELHKKDFAGIGSRHLMTRWGVAFEPYRMEVAQVWVTFANWNHAGEKRSIRSSLTSCLNSGVVVPIINEADMISDREIKLMDRGFSENDKLARMVACLMGVDAILFLTDNGGVYTADPKNDSRARMYEEIDAQASLRSLGISSASSGVGTGGMAAKFRHAAWCYRRGMSVAIAGNVTDVILRFVRGESVGTRIGDTTRTKNL